MGRLLAGLAVLGGYGYLTGKPGLYVAALAITAALTACGVAISLRISPPGHGQP